MLDKLEQFLVESSSWKRSKVLTLYVYHQQMFLLLERVVSSYNGARCILTLYLYMENMGFFRTYYFLTHTCSLLECSANRNHCFSSFMDHRNLNPKKKNGHAIKHSINSFKTLPWAHHRKGIFHVCPKPKCCSTDSSRFQG